MARTQGKAKGKGSAMVTKQDTPSPVVLPDEFVEQAANMIFSSEDRAKSLAFFQATLPESEVTRVLNREVEIRSAKSFAVMQPKLRKDANIVQATKLHGLMEEVSSLLVALVDVSENRVGGGASLEHKISKLNLNYTTTETDDDGNVSVTHHQGTANFCIKVGELDK